MTSSLSEYRRKRTMIGQEPFVLGFPNRWIRRKVILDFLIFWTFQKIAKIDQK